MAAPEDGTGSQRLLSLITASLDQDGAEDIISIPLAGRSPLADHMVIASGRSTRHVAALSENLVERMKHEAGVNSRVEGKEAADWVLIDTGDVIVHIFRPEVREFYQLEKMWQIAPEKKVRPA
jgi:ribosome-associated protein